MQSIVKLVSASGNNDPTFVINKVNEFLAQFQIVSVGNAKIIPAVDNNDPTTLAVALRDAWIHMVDPKILATAANNGNLEIIDLLYKNDACMSFDEPTLAELNPLYIACRTCNKDLIDYFFNTGLRVPENFDQLKFCHNLLTYTANLTRDGDPKMKEMYKFYEERSVKYFLGSDTKKIL